MIPTSLNDQQIVKVLEFIPEAIAVLDKNWNITYWNKSAQTITGFSPKQLVGKNFKNSVKLIKIQDRESSYSLIENTYDKGKSLYQNENLLIITSSGNEIPITASTSVLSFKTDKIDGVIFVFKDLNETRDAFRLRSDFNYLQHQLRTPLSSALWNLEMALSSQTLDKNTKDLLNTTLTAIESIRILSNVIIEVAQVDQGLVIPITEEVKISRIIELVEAEVSKLAKIKKIEVEVVSFDPSITLVTDIHFSSRILQEIVKNAIQFSASGSTVSLRAIPQPSGILFEIEDHGIGILPEENSMIFNKFFRGGNIEHKLPGSGLGLYLSLRYAKLLKGMIWFVSKIDNGSTFSILLPNLIKTHNHLKNMLVENKKT